MYGRGRMRINIQRGYIEGEEIRIKIKALQKNHDQYKEVFFQEKNREKYIEGVIDDEES